MDEATKDFLLAEFETAWQQVLNIDKRRGTFFNYYNISFIGVLSFTASLVGTGDMTILKAILLSATFVLLIVFGFAIKKILLSERKANIRYRHKINLIREIFLSSQKDPQIKKYLERDDLGIKIYTGNEDSIDEIGGTLSDIFEVICYEQLALGVLIILIWVFYCLG